MKLSTPVALSWALGLSVEACLLPHERGDFGAKAASTQDDPPDFVEGTGYPIGQGDRFHHGAIAPEGLGTKDRSLGSILNVEEVSSGLKGLSTKFPTVRFFEAPQKTFENRSVHGVVIGDDPRAFIQSGLHARERGGPDNVLYFVADLLAAARDGRALRYGDRTYTSAQVRAALSAGIVIVPLTNPDGVYYDQQTGQCWRKNRNPNGGGEGVGVDLNRNFDFLWEAKRYFAPEVQKDVASEDPSSEIYHGAGPASEPEVQNIQWVMAQHGNLSWFLDLHSFEGDVLFSWGDDTAQSTDPAENFANPRFDGARGGRDAAYGEFMEPQDFASLKNVSLRMVDAMSHAGSVKYRAIETASLYPTSGCSTDYAMSHYYAHKCGANRVRGIGMEFGGGSDFECPFYPTDEQYHESIRQVGVALMEFLLTAAGPEGKPTHRACYQ